MGEHNNIVAPHLNAEVYRNDTKISNTMSYLDYIRIHADGTTLIGCSELTGRYWNGGARIYKSVRESNTIVRDAKVSVSLNSGTADGCFIQNSDKVLLGEDNGSLSVWGRGDNVWAQWEEQIIVSEHDDAILSMDCLDPAKKYVTVGADANIKVWDIEELICETSYNAAHSMMITGVAVKPESSSTIATCSMDRHLTLWDTGSKTLVKDLATLSCGLRCLSWLDSHRLLIGDEAGALNVVDIRGEATLRELTIHPAPIHRIQKQPESNKVAVCCDNRIVTIYDVSDDNILQVSYKDSSMHNNYVRGMAWDPSDSNTLHTVGWDGTLRTHVMHN